MATRYINSLRPGNAYDVTFIIQILSIHFVWQVPNPIDSSQAKDVEEYLKQTKTPAMWLIYLKMNTTNPAEFHLAYHFSLSISLFPRTRRFDLKRHYPLTRVYLPWYKVEKYKCHYSDVKMGAIASQIISVTIVYSIVYSGADQRKHQSSASLALWGEFTGNRLIPRTKGQ